MYYAIMYIPMFGTQRTDRVAIIQCPCMAKIQESIKSTHSKRASGEQVIDRKPRVRIYHPNITYIYIHISDGFLAN